MKAFVVAALLVASVASQSMDMMNLIEPSHKKLSSFENLWLKEKLGSHEMDSYKYNTGIDFDTIFGGRKVEEYYTLEELVSHPIFREYLEIPLFRQLWEEHPVVFRHYVESPLFQQFWTVPRFQMYFRNPVLFYKYIVPQLQVIFQSVRTTTEGRYNWDTPTYSKYMPYAYRHHTRDWSVPMSMDKIFSSHSFPYTTGTNTRYLLEKMMSHMNINKKHLTETLTDVRMLNGKVHEQTVGKMVDPITGQEKITVGDFKTVTEKIVPQTMDFPTGLETVHYPMDKIFNTESMKDAILKHIILQKVLGNKVITPSVYETLFKDNEDVMTPEMYNMIRKHKQVMIPDMLDTIMGHKKVFSPEMMEMLFRNKHTTTPEVFQTIFGTKKDVMSPEVYEILFGNKHAIPETLETVFGKKIYNPEVYGTLFDEEMTTPEYYGYKYEPYTLKEKMMSPWVSRMLKNNKMNRFQKYQTEKMIEEIKKEKMMEELIKEYPMWNKDIIEMPSVFTTEKTKMHHIPLTFEKTVTGSVLEGFEKENNEIKF